MRRKRPKQLNHDLTRHSRLRRKWRKWLPEMQSDLTHLLGKREMFSELQEIAQDNPNILRSGSFFDWMCTNYFSAVTMSVRGFVDMRSDVRSLGRMLYEILEHPEVINRKVHVALYRGAQLSSMIDVPNASFDSLVGEGRSALSQKAVRQDLRSLEDATERVVRFTHKRIAHRAAAGELRRAPRVNELNEAIDVLDRIFCKYNCLLTASGVSTAFATRQYNWKEVLYKAWILPGSKFHPAT
jgi:hypothetical protein